MKHTVTVVHEVEAESWSDAVEKVLRAAPAEHLVDCRVKAPGKRLVHVMPSTIKAALYVASRVEAKP